MEGLEDPKYFPRDHYQLFFSDTATLRPAQVVQVCQAEVAGRGYDQATKVLYGFIGAAQRGSYLPSESERRGELSLEWSGYGTHEKFHDHEESSAPDVVLLTQLARSSICCVDAMESARLLLAEHPLVASFRWRHGGTFAGSYSFMISSSLGYLALISFLHLRMKNRSNPVALGPIPILHNIVLSVGSLVMFLGCMQASALQIESSRWLWGKKTVWNWLLCFPRGTIAAGPVFFWSYIYYLSKYYELIDTVVLILKKRPLTFLHVFHHVTVIFMSFFWLDHAMSLQIIALLTNTGVHVVMYTYYLLCSIGKPPAWKKLVTNLQIVQFVFSFVASIGTLLFHFRGEGCAGMGAWLFNAVFNALLLLLFLNFHSRQYRKGERREGKGKTN